MKSLRKQKTLLALLMSLTLSSVGCVSGKRVVLVDPDKTIIRIGPKVTGRIYTKTEDGSWELSRNKVPIPEGWYAGKMD